MRQSLLMLFFALCLPQSARAISDELKTAAAATAIAACAYGVGRGCAHLLYNKAYNRYDTARAIIVGYEYEEPTLRTYLKQEVMLDNESHFDRSSPYRNYPLVYYKNNIDWYITWLNRMRFFAFGSSLRVELRELAEDLIRIRRYVVTDPTFIYERRQADELVENRNHVPEVIVHHRS